MSTWLPTLVLAAIGVVLFLVPNHSKKPMGERPSLATSLVGLFKEPPPRWELWALAICAGWIIGCLSVFIPAVVLAVAQVKGEGRARVVFGVGGAAIIAGGVLAVLVMAISVMSFGWGAGRLAKPNVMTKVIPIFLGACGVAAIVLAAWGRAAAWAVSGTP